MATYGNCKLTEIVSFPHSINQTKKIRARLLGRRIYKWRFLGVNLELFLGYLTFHLDFSPKVCYQKWI